MPAITCTTRVQLMFKIAFVLSVFWFSSVGAVAQEASIHSKVQAIAATADSNRDSFTHGKCVYTYSIWTADSEEDAFRGAASKISVRLSRQMKMYLSGDNLTIKSEVDFKSIEEERAKGKGIVGPVNIIKRGNFAIDHDSLINNAIVHSPENFHLNIRLHPFNLASDSSFASVSASVNYAESKKYVGTHFKITEGVEKYGKKCILIEKSFDDDSHDIDYYLDPNDGYLAFVTEYFKRTGGRPLASRMRLLAVHREGDAVFPMHAIEVDYPTEGAGEGRFRVREMKVDELDLQYDPTPDDLSVCFPRFTQYYDGLNPKTSKSLFRDHKEPCTQVKCEDIAGISQQLQKLAVERSQEEQATVANTERVVNSPKGRRWLILIANGVALAVLILTFLWKRKKA